MSNGAHLDWVLTPKIEEMSGYTAGALDKLRIKGKVALGKHWKKDPNQRVIWNVKEFEKWQNQQASVQDQKAA